MQLGVPELLLVLAIVIIVFGAGKLPRIGKDLGEAITNFRKGMGSASEEKKSE
jgi:sec-independent protein translocase protein TatA